MFGPITLQANDLKNLDQNKSVDFFRRLLWAESSRTGINRHLIDVPYCINVGDGGLDAVIDNANPSSDDVIPSGFSGFQIKSSDLSPGNCKTELHQDNDIDNPLKDGILRLLSQDGIYILVLFTDITREALFNRRKQAIQEELERCGYPNTKVRLYTINQLISFAERYPSLIAWLKGSPNYLTYEKWASRPRMISPKHFIKDNAREDIIKEIRDCINNSFQVNQSLSIRLRGLPGIGKTRLVLEALEPDNIKNRVIYFNDGNTLRNNLTYIHYLIMNDINAVIVIDECSLRDHEFIQEQISGTGFRLSLITISHQMDKPTSETKDYLIKPLSITDITKLLKSEIQGLPSNVIDNIATFADGYPRIALLISESYTRNRGASWNEILNLDYGTLIDRLIAGERYNEPTYLAKLKRVSMGLSIFEKIGYKDELQREAKWIAEIIEVQWRDFQEVVNEQKRRGIVQGDYYIYLTPFPLVAYLINDWFNNYWEKGIEDFMKSIPVEFQQDMQKRFLARLPHLSLLDSGKEFIRKMFSEKGPSFNLVDCKNPFISSFFLRLAKVDPDSAFIHIKQNVAIHNKPQLINEFRDGRQEIVEALKYIAQWKDYFYEAANLLLLLAETDNSVYSNNAKNSFAGLFLIYPGPSFTELSPEQRLPVLQEALLSDIVERNKIALEGIKAALSDFNSFRIISNEYIVNKPLPVLWQPKTWQELFESYKIYWKFLADNIIKLKDEVKLQAISILINSIRMMVRYSPEHDTTVIDYIKQLYNNGLIDKKELLKNINILIYYEKERLPEKTCEMWKQFSVEITGQTFSDKLKRYVGMDFFTDYVYEDNNRDDKGINKNLSDIAQEILKHPDILEMDYGWLTTEEAKRGTKFGYLLGQLDIENIILKRFIEKQVTIGQDGCAFILGGYFQALYERDPEEWGKQLDYLAEKDNTRKLMSELIWRSELTDNMARKILYMVRNGELDKNSFNMFTVGGGILKLSEHVFFEWIKYFIEEDTTSSITVAVDMVSTYFLNKKIEFNIIPKDMMENLLLHKTFWENPEKVNFYDNLLHYRWSVIAKKFIVKYPGDLDKLTRHIIEFWGNENSIVGKFNTEPQSIIWDILKISPDTVWKFVKKYIGPPKDYRAFYLHDWLKGHRHYIGSTEDTQFSIAGAMEFFNPDDIWEWVEEDKDIRAPYLASFIPASLFYSDEKVCLAREFLIRYGDNKDVREILRANFSSMGSSGQFSKVYKGLSEYFIDFLKKENNQNVRQWINELLEDMERDYKIMKIREEERF